MDIIQTPKKNIIIDASTITTVESCGRLADFRFNHQLVSVRGKSNSLEAGSIVHKVLETYFKAKIEGWNREQCIAAGITAGEMYIRGCPYCTDFQVTHGDDTNITIGETALFHESEHRCTSKCILKPQCGHEPNEYPSVKNMPMESDSREIGWKWALATCEQYFDFWKNDYWVPLEVEVLKGKVLYEDDMIRILWKAKLDLIADTNQGIYPVDHKTAKQRRKLLSLNNQFIGQCLVMDTRGMVVNHIGFQTSLKPEEKFTRELMTYSIDRLIEWQSEILPYWAYKFLEYSEDGYWPPNFTHCENKYGHCAFKNVCEADPLMRGDQLRLEFVKGPKWDPTNIELD